MKGKDDIRESESVARESYISSMHLSLVLSPETLIMTPSVFAERVAPPFAPPVGVTGDLTESATDAFLKAISHSRERHGRQLVLQISYQREETHEQAY